MELIAENFENLASLAYWLNALFSQKCMPPSSILYCFFCFPIADIENILIQTKHLCMLKMLGGTEPPPHGSVAAKGVRLAGGQPGSMPCGVIAMYAYRLRPQCTRKCTASRGAQTAVGASTPSSDGKCCGSVGCTPTPAARWSWNIAKFALKLKKNILGQCSVLRDQRSKISKITHSLRPSAMDKTLWRPAHWTRWWPFEDICQILAKILKKNNLPRLVRILCIIDELKTSKHWIMNPLSGTRIGSRPRNTDPENAPPNNSGFVPPVQPRASQWRGRRGAAGKSKVANHSSPEKHFANLRDVAHRDGGQVKDLERTQIQLNPAENREDRSLFSRIPQISKIVTKIDPNGYPKPKILLWFWILTLNF